MKQRPLKPLKHALKEHYASKSLSEAQLTELMAMQITALESRLTDLSGHEARTESPIDARKKTNSVKTGSEKTKRHFLGRGFRGKRSVYYAAACVLFICAITVFGLNNRPPLSTRVMDEIAYNHRQGMPVEIASNSLADIRSYLNKLSFAIVLPSALAQSDWQLLGGRYCSINGKLAAQLKLKNRKNDQVYTLYQAVTEGSSDNLGSDPVNDKIDGVGVSIWREGGLLLGLASSL